jgi:two-component system, response regulator PdtaR
MIGLLCFVLAVLASCGWPPIKIVATSGLLNLSEDDLPSGSRFLPKPYSPRQVVGALRELTSYV